MNTTVLITKPSEGYTLLDSGNGEKLERFGSFTLRRPDPQALWSKHLSKDVWESADASFTKTWKKKKDVPEEWSIFIHPVTFAVHLASFKHTGVFPEQQSNWQWLTHAIHTANRPVSVLNLFGYTGGATVAALRAGASVCHVDASKSSISWARKNAELSGVADKSVRWIPDDAFAFVKREIRRGVTYDAIIMDPPAFGRGAKGEVWKIEKNLGPLLEGARALLSDTPVAFLLNGYSAGYSPLAYANNIREHCADLEGELEAGELAIQEEGSGRLLPAGIFARWSHATLK